MKTDINTELRNKKKKKEEEKSKTDWQQYSTDLFVLCTRVWRWLMRAVEITSKLQPTSITSTKSIANTFY